jgi:DNA-binding winged helix-turn-helix (wHTH) protein
MSGSCRFGGFELDVAAYLLRRGRQRVRLERIPMEVLILLVSSGGALVDRASIRSALWGSDVFLDHDSAINTAIRKIRQVLGDDPDEPRFIETVVGKGYRFIAPIDRLARGRAPHFRLARGTQEFALNSGDNVLGRDPGARVYVEHPSVSRQHARISIDGDRAVLEDLKSRNGTFLEGKRLAAPTEIHNGAVIALGPITLTFLSLSAASTRSMSGSVRGGAGLRSCC